MPSIRTNITIAAPPSTVRKVLLDFAAYPEWNPFITSVKVSDPAAPPGTPFQIVAFKFYVDKSTIVENNPEEFSWLGITIGKWFFRGYHYFKFESFGDGEVENDPATNCKFIQTEDMSGFLSFFSFLWSPILKKGFKQMNQALKVRAEALAVEGG
jgi:hypothetical protein